MSGNEVKKTSLKGSTIEMLGKNEKVLGSNVIKLLGNESHVKAKGSHKNKVSEKLEAIVANRKRQKNMPEQPLKRIKTENSKVFPKRADEESDEEIIILEYYGDPKFVANQKTLEVRAKKAQVDVATQETKQTLLQDKKCSSEVEKGCEMFLTLSHISTKRKQEEEKCDDVQRPKQRKMVKRREQKTKEVKQKRKENLKNYRKQDKNALRLARLERYREYMSQKPKNATEEEILSGTQKRTEHRRQRLEKETEEQRLANLRRQREKRKNETEEQRIARLAKSREAYKRYREKETEEERRKRLDRKKECKKLLRLVIKGSSL